MNLILEYSTFNKKNIFFQESVKNTVMNDSNFIRIIYSNKDFILNGIYIKININKDILQKNTFINCDNIIIEDNINENKNKLLNENKMVYQFIETLEKYILNKYNSNHIHSYKMTEQILYLLNKTNNCNNNCNIFSYILKISGLWETETHIGITYKFIYI